MKAIDAVDAGELNYFILQPDVTMLSHQGRALVQAKLTAIGDSDSNSNGKGVVESGIVLYDVSRLIPTSC